jgi:hypothetical protein
MRADFRGAVAPFRRRRYHARVTDFYDFDRANSRLPELTAALTSLRDLKREVVSLRDQIVELNAPVIQAAENAEPGEVRVSARVASETQRLRLRMQGLIDQMAATVARLDEWAIQLRDIETGLIDFPALVSGRQVWLCWRLGEERVEWWHELDSGFGGRQRLEDLV